MPDQANVKSFDAIQTVRAALQFFAAQSDEGLVEIESEIRRFIEWLEHDRPGYWKERVRVAYDEVGKARGDLQRCLMYPVGVNERPACTEERQALKKAEAHLEYCRGKQEKLKHWIREVNHELHTYHGRTTRLREVIEADVPNAASALNRLLATLEQYVGTGGGNSSASGTSSAKTDESNPDEQPPSGDGG